MDTPFVGMSGYAPVVKVEKVRPAERDIYRTMWAIPEYRTVAPGEYAATVFMAQAKPKPGASIIDFGCGTGRGALALALFGKLNVTMVDFADNCLDDDIRPMLEPQAHALRFVEADLTKPLSMVAAEYGFCTDVMEHIPPQDVDAVMDNCLHAAQHVFFQIATEDDVMGARIGHPLHLSVHPYEWWLKKFNDRECVVHWSQKDDEFCSFYVSAWINGGTIVDAGELNTTVDFVKANVKANVSGDWMQVEPHQPNDVEVMIIGGGPSLAGQIDEIKRLRDAGVKIVAMNGAYNWCIENGLTPCNLVMVDAREFNARFSKPVVPGCKFFIASQCHPSVLEGLPKDSTYLWHSTAGMIRDELNARYERWWGIPGGSTVLLRSIFLFRMLGFRSFHLFGCDSCLSGDQHHAYEQKENDGALVFPVNVGGRIFPCHVWMASQATEFIDMIKYFGNDFQLEIYGDGLLKHILDTGATLADLDMSVLA